MKASALVLPTTSTLFHVPKEPPARCWALGGDRNVVCDNGWHTDMTKRSSWRCAAVLSLAARGPLRELLIKCKVDPSDPSALAPRLRAELKPERQPGNSVKVYRVIDGATSIESITLGAALSLLDDLVLLLPDRNVFLFGKKGTGKTHVQLWLTFAALEQGVSAVWLDDMTLQKICSDRRSFEEKERLSGEQQWQKLMRAKLLVYNDLGADDHPPQQDRPGRPLLAEPLRQLAEMGSGRFCCSSNLKLAAKADEPPPALGVPVASLDRHRDVGGRVVSRLISNHLGVPALILKFEGRDQRVVL